MRKTFPPSARKPSPTATPFVPASSAANNATVSSSSESYKNALPERVNLPPGQIPCKFYMNGYCSRGAECWYMHDVATVPVPMIVEEGGKKKVVEVRESKGKGKATSPRGSEARTGDPEEASEGEPCAICFETPTTYGLLTNCDHVFCLSCIRSWRSSGNKNENAASSLSPFSLDDGNLNKTSKTCPLCRVRSKFIIPSSIFPTPPPGPRPQSSQENDLSTNPAKEAIVQRYLDKLGTIPCRYFQDSMTKPGAFRGTRSTDRKRGDAIAPFCPFGNECHYAHTGRTGEKYVFSDRELSNHRRSRTARGGRDRARWMERMLLGVFNDAERRHPLLHANGADAQAMLEILIERHAPEWNPSYGNFHDGEEEDEDIDEDDFEDDWQDEDEEPEPRGGINMSSMMNAMGFGSGREGFYQASSFQNVQSNERPRRDGAPAEAYPLRNGMRETRAEDGTLVVELDFFQLGRHAAHLPAEGTFRAGRSAAPHSLEDDEMPRLVDVDDLDQGTFS